MERRWTMDSGWSIPSMSASPPSGTNIATGETSQDITPFQFFHYSNLRQGSGLRLGVYANVLAEP